MCFSNSDVIYRKANFMQFQPRPWSYIPLSLLSTLTKRATKRKDNSKEHIEPDFGPVLLVQQVSASYFNNELTEDESGSVRPMKIFATTGLVARLIFSDFFKFKSKGGTYLKRI